MVSFYAFPVIIIDTVTANRYESEASHLSVAKINSCTFVGFMLIAVKVRNEKLGLATCFAVLPVVPASSSRSTLFS